MDTKATTDLELICTPIQHEVGLLRDFLKAEFSAPDPLIHEILEHVAQFRGKQLRPAMLFLATRLRGGECTADAIKIGAVIELIHTATLVHDDVLDSALLRRNVETVHRRWGERASVLIGDFIYSRAFQLSTEVDGMASVLSATTNVICEGELLQLQHRFDAEMSEERYYEIIRKKTAALYGIACELGGVLGGISPSECAALREFGLDLGMAFQIVDDCLDYTGTESKTGKSLGTDLRQNKMTLPLIYLRDCLSERDASCLVQQLNRPLTPEGESHILEMVNAHGVVTACLDRAEEFVQSARSRLKGLDVTGPAASAAREALELVGDYIIRRQC